MTTSDTIRSLARDGLPVADIARRLGIRYQHAYKVLRDAGMLAERRSNVAPVTGAGPVKPKGPAPAKPILTVDALVRSGFVHAGRWLLSQAGELVLERPLPKDRGVYAFVKDGAALYVGLATMGIAKRLYFYGRPGATQRTSQRVNSLLKAEIQAAATVDIYTATPADLEWNGLPVSGSAGLELGLIEAFVLPWNIRGVRA